jgi:hypothetical protein
MPCPVVITDGGLDRGSCCPGSIALRRWVVGQNGAFSSAGCYGYRNVAGTGTPSVHGTGRAFDVSIYNYGNSAHNASMWYVVNRLVSKYCELNIQRIIFDSQIWNSGMGILSGPSGWQDMTAEQIARGNHAHIEISLESCETLSYEEVIRVMNASTFPTKVTAPSGTNSASPTPTTTITTASSAAKTLVSTDTSGNWVPDNIKDVCGMPEDRVRTFVTCGGRGGYAVDSLTGKVCAVGLSRAYGNIGKKMVSFVPYGKGYYWISNSGYSIGNSGPDTAIAVPACVGFMAPYSRIYSPRSGKIIVVGSDGNGGSISCEVPAPSITGPNFQGPCC